MRELFKNSKGAVTVFVTLLLIPAILISGTAVDLARIHTARSIIQDGNQLAANSVLSQYNALLYDLYGVFAVAKDDPILGQLLDEYIAVSVFGEKRQDRSFGTLQLFYGSNLYMDEVYFIEDMNLRNEYVLQRQIEEYMKFRGPVIIVKDLLELLGLSTFKEDSGVINDKLDIESAIADIYEKYRELYNAIIDADKCTQVNGGIGYVVGTVSSGLDYIRQEFVNLRACYVSWEKATVDSVKKDYEAKFRGILDNIISRTTGSPHGTNWSDGRWQKFSSSHQGLNKTIENQKEYSNRQKPVFDKVVSIARQIDNMKTELSRKIDELEERINNGGCSDELVEALTERTGSPPKTILERYKDILKWDNIEGMAKTYSDSGYHYIDNILKPYLDDVEYRNKSRSFDPSLTRSQLANIHSNSSLALSESIWASDSLAAIFAGYTADNVTYNMPPGFIKFGEHPGDNKAFFEELKSLMNPQNVPLTKLFDDQEESSGTDSEDKQRNMITELMDLIKDVYAGLANDPLGAKHINNAPASGSEEMDFRQMVSEAPSNPVADVISYPTSSIEKVADHLLLLSYCTSMFSNYTTARPEITGKKLDEVGEINFPKSVTGIPISPEVNYFFHSEWEYLYNGSYNASNNLSAVTRLIFIVRLICNYITVFSVSEINTVISGIRTAFIWNPVLAIILSELVRAAFVAAESVVDVATLRAGYSVPLIKNAKKGEWKCTPSGIIKAFADVKAGIISGSSGGGSGGSSSGGSSGDTKGLTYSNYLAFFFIAKALINSDTATELTGRTADLIEWNIINYQNHLFCDEEMMAEVMSEEYRFKLIDMKTDFSITTMVDMRMLFLSMVFAQNFSDMKGIGLQKTMPIVAVDYRGY
ncbi:MAG: DUF5702 domain-containing protein [Oscillospiraceae bacterium]|jgi:hypothetical protein|nr:DUF5702 domain-containing protein [Oscillospiraceae bacterium]